MIILILFKRASIILPFHSSECVNIYPNIILRETNSIEFI